MLLELSPAGVPSHSSQQGRPFEQDCLVCRGLAYQIASCADSGALCATVARLVVTGWARNQLPFDVGERRP